MVLLLPVTGHGYELTLGLDSSYVHDSNFFRTENDEESADSVELGGTVSLEHRSDRLRYLGSYTGSYQTYRKQDESDGAEHRLRLKGSYDIDEITRVQLKNNFRTVRNQRYTRDDIRDGDTGQDSRVSRYQRNDVELLLQRDISSTWAIELNASHQFIDFNRNVSRSDSDSIGLGGRVLHHFAPRHRFAGGLSWVGQNFDGDDFRFDAEADYLIADLAWIYAVTEHLQLTVNGGPAWIKAEEKASGMVQETAFVGGILDGELFRANVRSCDFDTATSTGIASRCNATTPGAQPLLANNLGEVNNYSVNLETPVEKDDDLTFFGGVALEGRFADWTVDMELRRRQSSPSGNAIAAKLSQWRWEVGYTPPRFRWNAYVAGSWERREAFSRATIIDYLVIPGPEDAAQRSQAFTRLRDSSDRQDAFTALVGVRNQFSQHLFGEVGVSFRHTENRVSGQANESDTYFFVVNLSYVFDPIQF